ncbi:alpha/beta fold hydrolase [Chryseobacterium paridis]|uniref:Alpha/beta hydrolase n=1 Tax=Chryseobacterium paridis TaxID=2800328 RepID=A0ABS1FSF5_9FLAO|nr:alpha/beta hydrolase [Chryseobacterium paridis]MBK1895355.1 alpha/beta hydrolase [Chryseobacterium paridis]
MRKNTVFKNDEGRQKILTMYDNALQSSNADIKSKICKTSFGDTFILEAGNENDEVVVLLHGASSNSTSWISEISIYAQKYRVLAIDIIGEPGKSAEVRLPYETTDYAQWLNEVLGTLCIQKINLVGLSQGGWLGIRFASSFPEKINKLVLLSPAGVVKTNGSFVLKAIFYSLFGKAGRKKINKIILGNQKVDPKILEFMNLMQNNVHSRMDKEYIFEDHELQKLKMPVLVIGGRNDVVRSIERISERFNRTLPIYTTIIDEDKGHVLINKAKEIIHFLQD